MSAAQVRRWGNAGLIPYTPGHQGPERGRAYPPEAVANAVEAAGLIVKQGHSIEEAVLILFSRRHPVPEPAVRAAYRSILRKVSLAARAAADPLMDDLSPHARGARWARGFARTPRGRSWRARLVGAVAERDDKGRALTRLGRPDRPRTLHPAQGLRETMSALVMLLTGAQPSGDAQRRLLQAAGLENLSPEDLAEATPTIDKLAEITDGCPLDAIMTAIDWARSVGVIAGLVIETGNDLGISGAVADIETTSELELVLAAPAVVAQWQPTYEPPDDVRIGIAVATLSRAAGPALLPYLRPGQDLLRRLNGEQRSDIEQRLAQLASEYPEEVATLLELDG